MLRALQPLNESLINFKIGEVHAYSLSNYNYYVLCCTCQAQIAIEQFALHFKDKHLQEDANDASDINIVTILNDKQILDIPKKCKTNKTSVSHSSTFFEITCENDSKVSYNCDSNNYGNDNDHTIYDDQSDDNDINDDMNDENNETDDITSHENETDCTRLNDNSTRHNGTERTELKKNEDDIAEKIETSKEKASAETRFKCSDCDKTFLNSRLLENHQYEHTGIFCKICGKQFAKLLHLKAHIARHSAIKNMKCAYCEKLFSSKTHLLSHQNRHVRDTAIICELCGKLISGPPSTLRNHMRRHTGERPYKCETCGKCFFSCNDLNIHSVTHSSERPFECGICKATFKLKRTLRVHKKKHSDTPLSHVCQKCGKAFAEPKGLTAHERMHDLANSNVTLI